MNQITQNKITKTIFISDLHLTNQHPQLLSIFNKFLDYINSENKLENTHIDKLYILGDFFNYWIGNDSLEPWHQEIIAKFKELTRSTKIYFLVGNRDFLVNTDTSELFGFELINQNHLEIQLNNQIITLLHGDTLCTNDKSYQRFRTFIRNPFIQKIYLALPLSVRKKLAYQAKQQSIRNNHYHHNSSNIFDVTTSAVTEQFKSSNSNIMIHGHTHRPKVHKYKINNSEHTRYVLGDWHPEGAYYLEINNQCKNLHGYKLKYFKQD